MLNEIVNGAFSSIAIHFIGDNLAKGIHYAPMPRSATRCDGPCGWHRQVCAIRQPSRHGTGFTGLAKETAERLPPSNYHDANRGMELTGNRSPCPRLLRTRSAQLISYSTTRGGEENHQSNDKNL